MAEPYVSTLAQYHYFHRCFHSLQYQQSTAEIQASFPYTAAAAACPSPQMAQLPHPRLAAVYSADHTSRPDCLDDSDALLQHDSPGGCTHASDKIACSHRRVVASLAVLYHQPARRLRSRRLQHHTSHHHPSTSAQRRISHSDPIVHSVVQHHLQHHLRSRRLEEDESAGEGTYHQTLAALRFLLGLDRWRRRICARCRTGGIQKVVRWDRRGKSMSGRDNNGLRRRQARCLVGWGSVCRRAYWRE